MLKIREKIGEITKQAVTKNVEIRYTIKSLNCLR